jgi:hypothetical protein
MLQEWLPQLPNLTTHQQQLHWLPLPPQSLPLCPLHCTLLGLFLCSSHCRRPIPHLERIPPFQPLPSSLRLLPYPPRIPTSTVGRRILAVALVWRDFLRLQHELRHILAVDLDNPTASNVKLAKTRVFFLMALSFACLHREACSKSTR